MNQTSNHKEETALDALIVASLVGRSIDDVPDEELVQRVENSPELKQEATAILEGIGHSPFSKMLTTAETPDPVADKPAGMYRFGSDETLDPALKAEIDKKRKEIRNRLRTAQ